MAIAFDSSTTSTNSGSATLTFGFNNVAGNALIVAFTANKLVIPAITGVTYNGVALTASVNSPQNPPADVTVKVYYYYLLNPATGTNNVVITFTGTCDGISANALSYSGVGSFPQDTSTTGTGTTGTLTVTTTIDNSWIVGCFRNNSDGNGSAGSGTTRRSNIAGQNAVYDTGGALTPTGSYSINSTFGSTVYAGVGMSIAPPVPVTVTPDLRSYFY